MRGILYQGGLKTAVLYAMREYVAYHNPHGAR
jgi:hypothetical protein